MKYPSSSYFRALFIYIMLSVVEIFHPLRVVFKNFFVNKSHFE